jgi:hypothetical protein
MHLCFIKFERIMALIRRTTRDSFHTKNRCIIGAAKGCEGENDVAQPVFLASTTRTRSPMATLPYSMPGQNHCLLIVAMLSASAFSDEGATEFRGQAGGV